MRGTNFKLCLDELVEAFSRHRTLAVNQASLQLSDTANRSVRWDGCRRTRTDRHCAGGCVRLPCTLLYFVSLNMLEGSVAVLIQLHASNIAADYHPPALSSSAKIDVGPRLTPRSIAHSFSHELSICLVLAEIAIGQNEFTRNLASSLLPHTPAQLYLDTHLYSSALARSTQIIPGRSDRRLSTIWQGHARRPQSRLWSGRV